MRRTPKVIYLHAPNPLGWGGFVFEKNKTYSNFLISITCNNARQRTD
jgi:hypothetical protein